MVKIKIVGELGMVIPPEIQAVANETGAVVEIITPGEFAADQLRAQIKQSDAPPAPAGTVNATPAEVEALMNNGWTREDMCQLTNATFLFRGLLPVTQSLQHLASDHGYLPAAVIGAQLATFLAELAVPMNRGLTIMGRPLFPREITDGMTATFQGLKQTLETQRALAESLQGGKSKHVH